MLTAFTDVRLFTGMNSRMNDQRGSLDESHAAIILLANMRATTAVGALL